MGCSEKEAGLCGDGVAVGVSGRGVRRKAWSAVVRSRKASERVGGQMHV